MLCDVIVLHEQNLNNETVDFASAHLRNEENYSYDERLNEIISRYKIEINKYPETMAADVSIEHEIILKDELPVTAKYRRIPYSLRE